MASLFTRIINGELPGRFVHQDEHCVAFLSIHPLAPGHTLVVPRAEIDHWLDLPDDLLHHLTQVAKIIGQAQKQCFRCQKVAMMIAGLEVPHTHIHVVPINEPHDLDFANADTKARPEQLDAHCELLRQTLATSMVDRS